MGDDLPCILFTAFEPSGDEHAAPVITALRLLKPEVPIYALGGPKMAEAGATLIESTVDRAAMGAGVITKAWEHRARLKRLAAWLAAHPVAIHVPTDSPAANWAICKMVKRQWGSSGAKVMHLVAPQVWAWASWRVSRLQKWSDGVLCILPFEPAWFEPYGVKAQFIGHPLFDHPLDTEIHGWESVSYAKGRPHIALLPGSRAGEVNGNWPIMQRVFESLLAKYEDAHGVIAAADEAGAQRIRDMSGALHPRLRIVVKQMDAALAWADVVLSVSGTATLHVTRHLKPMAILYRVNPASWHGVGRWLMNTGTFTLPNLIAAGGPHREPDKHIVREFVPWLHGQKNVEPIVDELVSLIDDAKKRDRQIAALKQVVTQFDGHHPGAEAAEAIAACMRNA